MAVYVDSMTFYQRSPLGPQNWCHMWADTTEELHAMAVRIGLKREWYQGHGDDPERYHYDLVASRRERAVRLGAVETNFPEWLRKRKATR